MQEAGWVSTGKSNGGVFDGNSISFWTGLREVSYCGRMSDVVESSDKFLTCKEVAARWRCSERTVREMSELKPVRFSKRFMRYRLEDVQAFEDQSVWTSQPEKKGNA